ncbi:MAG: nitroreductase family protein [Christensenellales bacterium]|jgi:nitroreductase
MKQCGTNIDDIIETIKKRTSVRTYSPRSINPATLEAMSAFLKENTDNPFGALVRFSVLNDTQIPKFGTYGMMRGVKTYFAGCVKKGGMDLEGFGYAFERAVLFATAMGLGTCWIGGIFRREAFYAAMRPDGEYLPAISSLGYANDKKSLIDKAVAAGAGARNRKPFDELFFDGNFLTPLTIPDEPVSTCLEMVRLGPSASNKQPWRVVRTESGYHFYMKPDKRYLGNTLFGFCIQRIDMGIAACHFSLSAHELKVPGEIVIDDPMLSISDESAGYLYSFTWR